MSAHPSNALGGVAKLLCGALESVGRLTAKVEANPLRHVRWTPPQLALLRCPDKRVLLRTGNQFGKTWASLAEAIYRCRGHHPFKEVPTKPIRAYILCTAWAQSLEIQQKLWHLLPKDELHPSVIFDPVKGFRGRVPAVRFLNGSVLFIKTSRQGGLSLAGGTLDLVIVDEPPKSARVYAELDKRLMRTGGTLILSLTPINAPTDYLKELTERGAVTDLHYRMEPENFIPEGETEPLCLDDGTPMDAAWIATERSKALRWEEPVVCDGEWEFRAVERIFEGFKPSHIIPNVMHSDIRPKKLCKLAFGMDYGEDRLRTAAALILVDDTGPTPRIWILAEYAPDTATTTDMDAEGVVEMLAGAGLRWTQIDHAHGDKRYTDAKGRLTLKSGRLMLEAVERVVGSRRGLRPLIRSAKRGAGAGPGAVWTSTRWLTERMLRDGEFFIDARCTWLIECLNRWDGTEASKYKDGIDAIFYALRPWAIKSAGKKSAPVSVRRG